MNIQTIFDQVEGSEQVPELRLHFKRSNLSKDTLQSTIDQVEFLRKVFDPGTFEFQEEMIILVLDDQMRPTCFYRLAKGTKDSIVIDHRILMKVLLSCGAERFILSHNHPDGYALPSMADVELTHNVNLKTTWFGIDLIDHIVLSSLEEEDDDPGYFSLADNGYLIEL